MDPSKARVAILVLFVVVAGLAGCLSGSKSEPQEAPASDASSVANDDVTNSLEGTILTRDALPIPAALVTMLEGNHSQSTDERGRYKFVNTKAGDHLVSVSKNGFKGLTQRATVRDGFATILNFTLEEATTAKPYKETYPFNGQISCYAFVGTDPETGNHHDCGAIDPNNAPSHEFEFGPGGAQAQIEVFWQQTTALAKALTIKVETIGFGHQDVVFAHQTGETGMKVIIGPANMEKYYPNGGRVRVTMAAGASVTGDEAAADVGVALQQTFEVDFTVFFIEPGPPDFSYRAA